jgi:hypothetical protein
MPTIPQRIASAFAVLCGRYGDVTEMAQDREQSRQSLYREAEQVVTQRPWMAPRREPASRIFSDNSPSSGPRSKPSKGDSRVPPR